jgi:tetratricopeptide (TPR) repeat protein
MQNEKPDPESASCILHSAFCIPKIADFGLAKRLQISGGPTLTGEILGTPSYMAPEQASGAAKLVGPPADVYALGAVLYELLTGRPPFLAANPIDTLLQVLTQEAVPPRRFQPKVSRDLETICLACLEKMPARRYPSASALADDLERFLDGRPIHARPAGRLVRLAKWARRRPAAAALIGVSTLAALALLTLGMVRHRELGQHAAALEASAQRLERARDRAEENLRRARAAVGDMVHRLTQAKGTNRAKLAAVHRQALHQGLGYYRTFIQQSGDDPELQPDVADASFAVALITTAVGKRSEAIAANLRALHLYTRLTTAHPNVPRYPHQTATVRNNLGLLYRDTRQVQKAEAVFTAALRTPGRPKDAARAFLRAQLYNNLGNLYGDTRRPREAREMYRRALANHHPLALSRLKNSVPKTR